MVVYCQIVLCGMVHRVRCEQVQYNARLIELFYLCRFSVFVRRKTVVKYRFVIWWLYRGDTRRSILYRHH